MASELTTLAAPLAPSGALLPSLLPGAGVLVAVAVVDVVVVAGALLLEAEDVAVAVPLLFALVLLVLEAFEASVAK